MLVVGWMGVWKQVFIALLVGGKRAGDDAEFLALADLVSLKLFCMEHSTVDDFGGGKGILTTLESDEFSWGGGTECVNDEWFKFERNGEGGKQSVCGAKDSS